MVATAELFLVDAFAEEPFRGNPAAVVRLGEHRSDGWLQALAVELAQPVTAFVRPAGERFSLRWFTPTVELELCGHATIATAHVLWEQGSLPTDAAARFDTKAGELAVSCRDDRVALELPSLAASPAEAPTALLDGLGAAPESVHRAGPDYLVELASPDAVGAVRPDTALLATVDMRGVMVTAAGGADADFTSRFFAPSLGLPEDHVTGSAHAALAPFWAARLGRDTLVGHQVSARGGRLHVEVRGDRVAVAGLCRTVLSGEILV